MFSYEFISSMISEDYAKVLKNVKKTEAQKKKKKLQEQPLEKEDSESDIESDRKSRYELGCDIFFESILIIFFSDNLARIAINLQILPMKMRLRWNNFSMTNGPTRMMRTT